MTTEQPDLFSAFTQRYRWGMEKQEDEQGLIKAIFTF